MPATLWSFAVLLFLLVTAGATGAWLTDRLLPRGVQQADRFLVSMAVGLGTEGLYVFFMGLAGLLRPAILLAPLALAGILSWRRALRCVRQAAQLLLAPWRYALGELRQPGRRLWGAFLLLVLILAALRGLSLFLGALAPPAENDFDGLAYHLALPALFLRWGGIHYDPYVMHSTWPEGMEMLYLAALAAGSQAARTLHFCMGLLAAAACYRLARPAGRGAACVAMLVFWFIPVIGWEAGIGYNDLAFAFYEGLAFLCVSRAALPVQAGGARFVRWLVAAGIAQGLALGIKYTALAFLPILLPLAGISALRLFQPGRPLRSIVQGAGLTALWAALVGCPWYIRTWLWTGNPVYPFAYGVFGGRYWSRDAEVVYRHIQLEYGTGRGPLDFLLSPWQLLIQPARFFEPSGTASFGAIFSAVGPACLLLVMLFLVMERKNRSSAILLGGFACFFVEWYALMQQVRYLIPAFPLLMPACGAGLYGAWRLPRRQSRIQPAGRLDAAARQTARTPGPIITATLASAVLLAFFLWMSVVVGWSELWPRDGASALYTVLGLQSREDFLAQRVPGLWTVSSWINASTPPTARIALIGEKRGFYIQRLSFWADGHEQEKLDYAKMHSAQDLLQSLRKQGFTHVLVRLGDALGLAGAYGTLPADGTPASWADLRYQPSPSGWPPDPRWLGFYRDAVLSGGLQQVYPDPLAAPSDLAGYVVYAVAPQESPPARTGNAEN